MSPINVTSSASKGEDKSEEIPEDESNANHQIKPSASIDDDLDDVDENEENARRNTSDFENALKFNESRGKFISSNESKEKLKKRTGHSQKKKKTKESKENV